MVYPIFCEMNLKARALYNGLSNILFLKTRAYMIHELLYLGLDIKVTPDLMQPISFVHFSSMLWI